MGMDGPWFVDDFVLEMCPVVEFCLSENILMFILLVARLTERSKNKCLIFAL